MGRRGVPTDLDGKSAFSVGFGEGGRKGEPISLEEIPSRPTAEWQRLFFSAKNVTLWRSKGKIFLGEGARTQNSGRQMRRTEVKWSQTNFVSFSVEIMGKTHHEWKRVRLHTRFPISMLFLSVLCAPEKEMEKDITSCHPSFGRSVPSFSLSVWTRGEEFLESISRLEKMECPLLPPLLPSPFARRSEDEDGAQGRLFFQRKRTFFACPLPSPFFPNLQFLAPVLEAAAEKM